MPALTVELAASLPGPDWLVARRAESAQRALATSWPTTDEEVWRYSLIDDLDLDDFAPVTDRSAVAVPDEVAALLASLPDLAGSIVVRNGVVVHVELDAAAAAKGVFLGRLADAPHGAEALGSVAVDAVDVFADLNGAFTAEPLLFEVPAGVTLDRPVAVIDWLDAPDAVVFPRLVVRAGADSDARLLEWHGSADVRALSVPVVELDLAAAARVGYVHVQQRGPDVWQLGSQVSRVERDATLTAAQAALGGHYARSRADCRLVGRGATGNLLAVYFGGGEQTLDFRTFQEHVAPDTTSNLLFKGALDGHARSVYTGLIKVDKGARGTNAFQTNRNIKLSEFAWAESVPNLEIENNDVHCSHASTIGPIDEDQRFYVESRGVPPDIAERLIVSGFFDEVLEQFPVAPAAVAVKADIDRRLEQEDPA